jgi:large subunit ribosomal protein L17
MRVTRAIGSSPKHRQMLLRTLITHLVRSEQIKTTVAKAKEARRHADRLITLVKRGTSASIAKANGLLLDRRLVKKLHGVLAKRYSDRAGGYTSIHLAGFRKGDSAPMAILSYVQPGHVSSSKRRRARSAVAGRPLPPTYAKPDLGFSTPGYQIGTAAPSS